MPKDDLIEQLTAGASGTLLAESVAAADDLVALMAKAEAAASLA